MSHNVLCQPTFSRETEPICVCVCAYVTLFLGLAHLIIRVGKSEIHRAGRKPEHSGRSWCYSLEAEFLL